MEQLTIWKSTKDSQLLIYAKAFTKLYIQK